MIYTHKVYKYSFLDKGIYKVFWTKRYLPILFQCISLYREHILQFCGFDILSDHLKNAGVSEMRIFKIIIPVFQNQTVKK